MDGGADIPAQVSERPEPSIRAIARQIAALRTSWARQVGGIPQEAFHERAQPTQVRARRVTERGAEAPPADRQVGHVQRQCAAGAPASSNR